MLKALFPAVQKIVPAYKRLDLSVTQEDVDKSKGQEKSTDKCVVASCCRRQHGADGVLVRLENVYLIFGEDAVAYRTPQTLNREIVSFDRAGIFYPGEYHLNPMPRRKMPGVRKHVKPRRRGSVRRVVAMTSRPHVTEDVRSSHAAAV